MQRHDAHLPSCSILIRWDEPLNLSLKGGAPGLMCTEGVSKSGKEATILKEGVSAKAQDHTGVLSNGPPRGGSQEFWFGENCYFVAGIVQDD